jgi:pyridoxal phosphate enzyme (YggS family)
MIHSIDSLKLLKEVQKQAVKSDRKINVLLQMHIATEESKFGLSKKELIEILEYYTADPSPFTHLTICGLMGMATFTEDQAQVKSEFESLKDLFDFCKSSYLLNENFKEISMGMSGDYKIAIDAGSTMVRVGSLLFGKR